MNAKTITVCLMLVLFTGISKGQNYCVRFFGNGVNDIDRIKIPIDAPEKAADVGGDFTIEFKMKALLSENPLGGSAQQGANDDWTLGHVIVDRDIFGGGDYGDYGISLVNGRIAFGVNNGSDAYTIIGNANVADNQWHDIAVTRSATTGKLAIWVDGMLDDSITTNVTGDISYRNNRSTVWPNDPYIVLGAEKHDYDNSNYPSYSGFFDEFRISDIVRYSASYTPVFRFADDVNTRLLYHLDEGSGTTVGDAALLAGNNSAGVMMVGGAPVGPQWVLLHNLQITSISDSVLCAGDSLVVQFQLFGQFSNTNVVALQLSDSSGNFSNPTVLASITTANSGSMATVIPSGTPNGSNYRLRLVSSQPTLMSNQYSSSLQIGSNCSPCVPFTSAPGPITGPSSGVCVNTTQNYSISPVPGATSYVWSTTGAASVVSGQGSPSVAVNFGPNFTTGSVRVQAVNACDTSSIRLLSIKSSTLPTPGVISGPVNGVCAGSTQVYSTAPVSGATGYSWSVGGGDIILSGNPTGTTATFNFGPNFTTGVIRVQALNNCGGSGFRTLSIRSVPNPPGIITGPTTVLPNSNVAYSIASVAGATSYLWQVTGAASITSGMTTTNVNVFFTPAFSGGIVRVQSVNACGGSSWRSVNVTTTAPRLSSGEKQINIFPIPSSGHLVITAPGIQLVAVYDTQGRQVFSRMYQNESRTELKLSLPQGIYFLEVVGDGWRESRKWVVQ